MVEQHPARADGHPRRVAGAGIPCRSCSRVPHSWNVVAPHDTPGSAWQIINATIRLIVVLKAYPRGCADLLQVRLAGRLSRILARPAKTGKDRSEIAMIAITTSNSIR